VPLSDLVDEAKALVLAGAAAQADVDAILSAPPTPEQISEQIIAEDEANGVALPSELVESAPCLPPFAALQAWCEVQPPLTVYDPLWQRNPDIHAVIAAHLREDIKALRAERDAAVADADHWRDKFVQVVEPASRSPEDDLKTLAEVAELRAALDEPKKHLLDRVHEETARADREHTQAELERATADALRDDNNTLRAENDRLITRLAQTSTAAPGDPITLAYLRQGWPQMSIADREQVALRLLDDLCRPPHERGTGWIALVRAVPSGVGLTPAELSAATAKEGK
jgi:hypothetical protein